MKCFFLLIQLGLIGLASAQGIQVQAISDESCGGNGGTALFNVIPNPGDRVFSSGCVTGGTFSSVTTIGQVTPGFVCNIYADASCDGFLKQLSEGVCSPGIGRGILCFAQSLFDNPFALSKAGVTIGNKRILVSGGQFGRRGGMDVQLDNAVSQSCGSNGCDQSDAFELKYDFLPNTFVLSQEVCTQAMTLGGNYDNTDQRDYMKAIIAKALVDTSEAPPSNIFSNSGDQLQTTPSFVQVVINDSLGNNQAEMTLSITVSCKNAFNKALDCDGVRGKVTSSALGAIPSVGGLAAGLFEVACTATG